MVLRTADVLPWHLTGFHSGEILGMDVCARRSLLASISTDQSIRLWDFKRWTSDLVHT